MIGVGGELKMESVSDWSEQPGTDVAHESAGAWHTQSQSLAGPLGVPFSD